MSDTDEDFSAYDRASIDLPSFKKRDFKSIYDYENEIVDYENLEALNRAIRQARLGLFKVTEHINQYERLETDSKTKYERALRRETLKSTAKTENERKARASLKCEDLENDWLVHHQTREELVRFSHALRLELQSLQGLGNNLRQQMKI